MQMTEEEICRSYRQAAFPKKQVGILAELNQVKKTKIAEILRRGGCDVLSRKNSARIKWTDDKVEQLRELRESGMTIKEIAVVLGAGQKAVSTKLHLEGIVIRGRRN